MASAAKAGAAYDSARVPEVLQALIQTERLLAPSEARKGHDVLFAYDLDALRAVFKTVVEAFPPHFLHCYAVKAAPMAFVIKEAVAAGLGVEAASLLEVEGALAAGCPPDCIVFDSPAKTYRELEFALEHGIHINANTLEELDRVASILAAQGLAAPKGTVGLRINPLVGAGRIAELSVSTLSSKFGVNLIDGHREEILERFRRYPWLCGLHIHVGSQGFDVSQTARGVRVMMDFVGEVEASLGLGEGQRRVTLLDIGGGLSANYASDDVAPTHAELVAAIREVAPELLADGSRRVVTEYGRSVTAKAGWAVSRVEYAFDNRPDPDHETFLRTAILHVGADALLRECYVPHKFPHRFALFDHEGRPVQEDEAAGRPLQPHQLAGPLCFAGDVIAKSLPLPRVAEGDYLVVHDTGGYTLALFSRYCSRPAPAVVGYSFAGGGKRPRVELLQEVESPGSVLGFWGDRKREG